VLRRSDFTSEFSVLGRLLAAMTATP